MKKQKIVIVLGMHRSGTSLITSSLRVFGVELGNEFLAAAPDNPKGFWEDAEINKLNIDMLREIGSDWQRLSPITPKDLELLEQSGYLLRALELLKTKMGDSQLFGFKDPRVAKLLPLWRQVFEHMEVDVEYIICVRNPLSIVKSLFNRSGIDRTQSYYLWLGHMVESLRNTKSNQRVLVDYDLLVKAPLVQIERLSSKLSVTPIKSELDHFLGVQMDSSLRNSSYEIQDMRLDNACPAICIEVYSELLQVASEHQIDDRVFSRKINRWSSEFSRLEALLNFTDGLQKEEERLRKELGESLSITNKQQSQLSESGKLVADLNTNIKDLESNLLATQEASMNRDLHIKHMEAELFDVNSQLLKTREDYADGVSLLECELSENVNSLAESRALSESRDKHIRHLESHDSPLYIQSLEQHNVILNRESELNRIRNILSLKQSALASARQENVELHIEISDLYDKTKLEDTRQTEASRTERAALLDFISRLEKINLQVASSASWRLTSPLRRLNSLLQSMGRIFRRGKNKYENVDFDAYLEANPDVATAVEEAVYKDARSHFEEAGAEEVRSGVRKMNSLVPYYIENEYLMANLDIQDAISAGKFESGFEHYLQHGLGEIVNNARKSVD
jgi:hypothetical protein